MVSKPCFIWYYILWLGAATPEQLCLGPYLLARKPCAPISDDMSHLCHLSSLSRETSPLPHSLVDATLSFHRGRCAEQAPAWALLTSMRREWQAFAHLSIKCYLCVLFFTSILLVLSLCVLHLLTAQPSLLLPLSSLSTPPSGLSTAASMRETGKRPREQWTQLSWDGAAAQTITQVLRGSPCI